MGKDKLKNPEPHKQGEIAGEIPRARSNGIIAEVPFFFYTHTLRTWSAVFLVPVLQEISGIFVDRFQVNVIIKTSALEIFRLSTGKLFHE